MLAQWVQCSKPAWQPAWSSKGTPCDTHVFFCVLQQRVTMQSTLPQAHSTTPSTCFSGCIAAAPSPASTLIRTVEMKDMHELEQHQLHQVLRFSAVHLNVQPSGGCARPYVLDGVAKHEQQVQRTKSLISFVFVGPCFLVQLPQFPRLPRPAECHNIE